MSPDVGREALRLGLVLTMLATAGAPVLAPVLAVVVVVDAWARDLTHRHGAALLGCLAASVYAYGAWSAHVWDLRGADEICGGEVARAPTTVLLPLVHTCHLADGTDRELVPTAVDPALLACLLGIAFVVVLGRRRVRARAGGRPPLGSGLCRRREEMTVSTDATRAFLAQHAPHLGVVEPEVTTATVADAAAALGVAPGQIAKTLAVRAGDRTFLLVAAGDVRLDNAKFRAAFGSKPRMLDAEETERFTGQPVGGVGPLGHAEPLELHLDTSLREHDTVYPAAGSRSSAFAVTPAELAALTGADWVDVTRRRE